MDRSNLLSLGELLSPSPDRVEHLLKIAVRQRDMLVAFLAQLAVVPMLEAVESRAVSLTLPALPTLALVVAVVRLAVVFTTPPIGVVLAVAAAAPVVNLFPLWLLSYRSTAMLAAHDVPVGLLGADPGRMRALRPGP